MKFFIIQHSPYGLKMLLEFLPFLGEVRVLDLSKMTYDIENIDIDLVLNNLEDFSPTVIISDKKSTFFTLLQDVYRANYIVSMLSKNTGLNNILDINYDTEKLHIRDKNLIPLIEKLGGSRKNKSYVYLEPLDNHINKKITLACLISQASFLDKLTTGLSKTNKKQVVDLINQCLLEYSISKKFNIREIITISNTIENTHELINNMSYYFHTLLNIIDELKEINKGITLLIPVDLMLPLHLNIHEFNITLRTYDTPNDLIKLYQDIKIICISPLVDLSTSYFESIVFDTYINSALPIFYEQNKSSLDMFISRGIELKTFTTMKNFTNLARTLISGNKELDKHINTQKQFILNTSKLFKKWSLNLLSTYFNLTDMVYEFNEIIYLPMSKFNLSKKLLINISSKDKQFLTIREQDSIVNRLTVDCEEMNIPYLILKEDINVNEKVKKFKPTHFIGFSNMHFTQLYKDYQISKFIFTNTLLEMKMDIEDLTYLTSSSMLHNYAIDNNIDNRFIDMKITNLTDKSLNFEPENNVCLLDDISDRDKTIDMFFQKYECNQELIQQLLQSCIDTNDLITLYKILQDNKYDKLIEYFDTIEQTISVVTDLIHNHKLVQCANILTTINECSIYGNRKWLDIVVDNIEIPMIYSGTLKDENLEVVSLVSNYKIFIWTQKISLVSIYDSLELLLTLHDTLVILPIHMEEEITNILDSSNIIFYNTKNLKAILNKYLVNNNLRQKTIKKIHKDILHHNLNINKNIWTTILNS